MSSSNNKIKKKSILKLQEKDKEKTERDKQTPEVRKSIKWDEENVIATLHPVGKDYGHMKIDEPPTPYERSVEEPEEELDAELLARRLKTVRPRASTASVTSSYLSDDEDDSPEERNRKRDMFRKRRAHHYNEYLEAKKKLAELGDDDDEEEQDRAKGKGSKRDKSDAKGKHK